MMRDKIAALMWKTQATDVGTPHSVAAARTLEAFEHESEPTRKTWLKQADAIIAALPDMIEPLVWCESEGNFVGQTVWSYDSDQTMWIVKNPDDEEYILCKSISIDFAPCSPVLGAFDSIETAKSAANTHHRAAIMAAFGVAQ